jgi:hypothetical protein
LETVAIRFVTISGYVTFLNKEDFLCHKAELLRVNLYIQESRMWKALLLVAAALGFLWWVGSIQSVAAQQAPDVKMVVAPMPVPCTADGDLLLDKAKQEGFVLTWQGVLQQNVLYQLYLQPGGAFMLVMEKANNPIICVVAAGEDNELLGVGGI